MVNSYNLRECLSVKKLKKQKINVGLNSIVDITKLKQVMFYKQELLFFIYYKYYYISVRRF